MSKLKVIVILGFLEYIFYILNKRYDIGLYVIMIVIFFELINSFFGWVGKWILFLIIIVFYDNDEC